MFVSILAGCHGPNVKVRLSKTRLLADGYDRLLLRIDGTVKTPHIEVTGDRLYCKLQPLRQINDHWEVELRAGVLPGHLSVGIPGFSKTISVIPQITDSASDGTPDFFRLDDESDRESFRQWIAYLAEIQYFIEPNLRPAEIVDCSSLVRYSYREALKQHDSVWTAAAKLPLVRTHGSIQKFWFPHTPLGASIFRTRPGSYSPADLNNGTFAEFADASTLRKFNSFLVSRDVARAQQGDVLFYRRETARGATYHSMIFVGPSQAKADNEIYVVYHTGPDGSSDGEIRRLTLTQLLHFSNPQWHPIAANELFLGVFRWNILKVTS